MQPTTLLVIFLAYFALLIFISIIVNKKSKEDSFYHGDRKSPWFVVAFGMIGATLSGVTFVSVPGEVGNTSFHYFQFILGNFAGYIVIATLLLPFYYRKNILSIYTVLKDRMGERGYLTTSGFFILSKLIGASFRLYLAAIVIHLAIAAPLHIPFAITVLVCLLLIWLYTFRSGIKTLVWSDTLQTLVLLLAVILTIVSIWNQLELTPAMFQEEVLLKQHHRIFEFDWKSPNNFFKQFFAGIFMTIALNGFDQDIIQKNLTCENSSKARKNMLVFSVMFVFTVFLFLILGSLLYYYAGVKGITLPTKSDEVFPLIAFQHLGKFIAATFILGISAAAFSSADSATTALTTAFSVDFLKIGSSQKKENRHQRNWVHLVFNLLIFLIVLIFYKMNDQSVVVSIFKAAGYTYGPILGVFLFSFFVQRKPFEKLILPICLVSPIFTWLFTLFIQNVAKGYAFGFELIIINALITLLLLTAFSRRTQLR
jgi:Na+/proline symporter